MYFHFNPVPFLASHGGVEKKMKPVTFYYKDVLILVLWVAKLTNLASP